MKKARFTKGQTIFEIRNGESTERIVVRCGVKMLVLEGDVKGFNPYCNTCSKGHEFLIFNETKEQAEESINKMASLKK